MDGDSSAKAMDKGAAAAAPHVDYTSGIHENAKPRTEPLGEKTTGATSMFDKDGAIGKQFTTGGALGGTAQKVGGPFDKEGIVGKQFTESGSLGGSVQETLGKGESNSINKDK